jgi:hypothetical protein
MIITRKIVTDNDWKAKDGPMVFVVFTQTHNGIFDLVYKEEIAPLWEFSGGIGEEELGKILTHCQNNCLDKLKGGYVLFAQEAQFKHVVTETEKDIIKGLK